MYLAAAIPGPPINITVLPGVREAVISWDNNGANATMYTLLYKQKQMNTSPWSQVRKRNMAQIQFSQIQCNYHITDCKESSHSQFGSN